MTEPSRARYAALFGPTTGDRIRLADTDLFIEIISGNGRTGPGEGSKATTVTPGSWHLARILESLDTWPLNVALLGKGNTVSAESMWEQLRGGAAGFKLHEDWGTTPAAIDACGTASSWAPAVSRPGRASGSNWPPSPPPPRRRSPRVGRCEFARTPAVR